MNNNDYTLKLLNIQDEDIKFIKIELINNNYVIELEQTRSSTTSCPNCGGMEYTLNSIYTRTIKNIPINGVPSIILLKQLRFKCKFCKHSFNQPNKIDKYKKSISNELYLQISKESKYKQSFKDISTRTNVSQTTVSNEFKQYIHNYRCKLTRIICIDEFKASTIAGKYALIIGDPETGKILDILPSRLQEYIYYYFNTIDKSERLSVKYVVTDLFESYRTICKNLFWDSIHIADRFHWIRLTTEAFNKTRISIMNMIIKSKTKDTDLLNYASVLKKYYKLLLANKYSKESWFFDQQVNTNKFGFTSYQSVIEFCVNKDPEFEEAYTLLQELYKISRLSSFETAKKDILEWCEKIDNSEFNLVEFKKVSLTYRSWIKEIVNSFIIDPITHKRLSNGFIEGKNNFCKVIKRIGFGYSDFDIFRHKILNSNDKINKLYTKL